MNLSLSVKITRPTLQGSEGVCKEALGPRHHAGSRPAFPFCQRARSATCAGHLPTSSFTVKSTTGPPAGSCATIGGGGRQCSPGQLHVWHRFRRTARRGRPCASAYAAAAAGPPPPHARRHRPARPVRTAAPTPSASARRPPPPPASLPARPAPPPASPAAPARPPPPLPDSHAHGRDPRPAGQPRPPAACVRRRRPPAPPPARPEPPPAGPDRPAPPAQPPPAQPPPAPCECLPVPPSRAGATKCELKTRNVNLETSRSR